MNDNNKVVQIVTNKGEFYKWMFFCPACNEVHGLDKRWTFNGDFDKPTFRASVLVKGTIPITDEEHAKIVNGEKFEPKPRICHSFVTDGEIKYLGDCTHDMKNTTVRLKEW